MAKKPLSDVDVNSKIYQDLLMIAGVGDDLATLCSLRLEPGSKADDLRNEKVRALQNAAAVDKEIKSALNRASEKWLAALAKRT